MFNSWFRHQDRLKAALQRSVFFYVLLVLIKSGGPNKVQLATGCATSGSATLGAAALILDRATGAAAMLPQGGLILSVDAGGPASVAGLVQGDVVTAVNGVAVDAGHPFDAVALGLAVDQQVTLTVVRGGVTKTIALTVGSTSPSAQS